MTSKKVYLKITDEMELQLNERANKMGVPRASIIKQILCEGLKNE